MLGKLKCYSTGPTRWCDNGSAGPRRPPSAKRPCEELLRHVVARRARFANCRSPTVAGHQRDAHEGAGETQVYAIPEPLRQVPSPTIEQELTQCSPQACHRLLDGLLAAVDPQRQILVFARHAPVRKKLGEWLDQSATRVATARVQDRSPVSQSKDSA